MNDVLDKISETPLEDIGKPNEFCSGHYQVDAVGEIPDLDRRRKYKCPVCMYSKPVKWKGGPGDVVDGPPGGPIIIAAYHVGMFGGKL